MYFLSEQKPEGLSELNVLHSVVLEAFRLAVSENKLTEERFQELTISGEKNINNLHISMILIKLSYLFQHSNGLTKSPPHNGTELNLFY